jgi:hypothetical protein
MNCSSTFAHLTAPEVVSRIESAYRFIESLLEYTPLGNDDGCCGELRSSSRAIEASGAWILCATKLLNNSSSSSLPSNIERKEPSVAEALLFSHIGK